MRSSVSDMNDVCKRAIDEYYPKFVDFLIYASTVTVPVIKVNGFKQRWSDELTELKVYRYFSYLERCWIWNDVRHVFAK